MVCVAESDRIEGAQLSKESDRDLALPILEMPELDPGTFRMQSGFSLAELQLPEGGLRQWPDEKLCQQQMAGSPWSVPYASVPLPIMGWYTGHCLQC